MRKLPSINLLVTFEAAARHLSFKKAAEELFVTSSAVGHQIRILEEQINTQLFLRGNRSLELTQDGRDYFHKIKEGLRALRNATEDLISQSEKDSLVIHSIPFITKNLLIPRIREFKQTHPHLNIRIESKTKRADLDSGKLEVAIRQGMTTDKKTAYKELCPILITPVCAPGYLNESSHSLIRLSSDKRSWALWNQEWGDHFRFDEVIECDDLQSVLDMTTQGMGIAMGFFPSIKQYIDEHQLECPFPNMKTQLDSLYFAYSVNNEDHPVIDHFTRWFSAIINAS